MSEKTLEQNFERLEELTAQMESGELSLEKMYVLYKEGIDLVKECNKKIDTVEKNMKLINDKGECSDFE
ncbi:MAG TPA: exodeoxyribonuclease VII small subunit [Candidatus Alectryocaccobium stercorigallinarum]|jgi:exodeoxyribonuclease VII small subunit|nr:exodeoxyribonuclease VII small subunit [Candidatus Alectryocaccobium stercorigallinarum]